MNREGAKIVVEKQQAEDLPGKGLVSNYGEGGELQNGRGGHVKFYPYEKGGQERF